MLWYNWLYIKVKKWWSHLIQQFLIPLQQLFHCDNQPFLCIPIVFLLTTIIAVEQTIFFYPPQFASRDVWCPYNGENTRPLSCMTILTHSLILALSICVIRFCAVTFPGCSVQNPLAHPILFCCCSSNIPTLKSFMLTLLWQLVQDASWPSAALVIFCSCKALIQDKTN